MASFQGHPAPAPTAPPGSVRGRGYGHTATETENQINTDVSHILSGKQERGSFNLHPKQLHLNISLFSNCVF